MDRLLKIKSLLEKIDDDVFDFWYKGNQAAGRRVRKAMLEIIKYAQMIRVEILELRDKK
jgi:hypothetical protein